MRFIQLRILLGLLSSTQIHRSHRLFIGKSQDDKVHSENQKEEKNLQLFISVSEGSMEGDGEGRGQGCWPRIRVNLP